MHTIAQVSTAMQLVLHEAAEQADVTLHYTKRPDVAKFSASTLVQTLVFGWLAQPDATLEQLAQVATRLDVDVQLQAIDQRFTFATATLLHTVLQQCATNVIASDSVAIPLLQRFTGVRVMDSSTIVLPDALADYHRGCGGSTTTNTAAAAKLGVQLDLLTGVLSGVELVDGRTSDHRLAIQQEPVPPGTVRLADLGFYDLNVFARIAAEGGYWLSKVDTTAVISAAQQPAVDLLTFVRRLGDVAQWDGAVWVGRQRLPARLLLQRVPQEVADQRRRRLRKEARDKGRQPSATALALADWTILMTNIPATLLQPNEALTLIRVRWQIELLFKLWKSHGNIDTWRSTKPARILCELYAKCLAMLIQHWLVLVGCWSYPDRSLVKAAQVIRSYALELASARMRGAHLSETLQAIAKTLRRKARLNSRSTKPNTYQLLLALTCTAQHA